MKNLTWQNPEQLFVAQVLINKVKSKCCGIKDDEKPHGDIDVAIAAEHLCLAATECGLGTCWVCNYDTEKMQQFFAREGYEAVVIIPVGHIAEDCPRTEKKRKEMSEITEEI